MSLIPGDSAEVSGRSSNGSESFCKTEKFSVFPPERPESGVLAARVPAALGESVDSALN